MSTPRTAAYAATRLADIPVDPGDPDDPRECSFHLVRRHFDVQAFGVNAAAGNTGDTLIFEHHERDDAENGTEGHEELFMVTAGHARFTVDGEELDAPAGTLVFVRDPALLRGAQALADDTTILMIGGPPGRPYGVSRWEQDVP